MFFFFNDTATTEIYTLSLHDALPILLAIAAAAFMGGIMYVTFTRPAENFSDAGPATSQQTSDAYADSEACADRKSTRLNSSHANISYAVFCLKKKKQYNRLPQPP